MLAVSIPELPTPSEALVETATKVLRDRIGSSPPSPASEPGPRRLGVRQIVSQRGEGLRRDDEEGALPMDRGLGRPPQSRCRRHSHTKRNVTLRSV